MMSSVPSDRERLQRLETRAREAEVALRQLKSYVQLLKQKSGSPQSAADEAECQRVEEDNRKLAAQVTLLKQRLIELEIRNGVEQIPTPKHTTQQSSQGQSTTVSSNGSVGQDNGETVVPQPSTPSSQTADKKEETSKSKKKGGGDGEGKAKKEKKAGGGGGGGGGTVVDVSRLDMRIGRIMAVKRHPDADSLYVEEIDVGEEKPRTVCSGLVAHVAIETMNNRLVVVLCNLKPVKMRGIVSEAMVMCASSPENIEILDPPDSCVPGDLVRFKGYDGTPDALLNPKKKVFEQVQPDFLVNEEGVATYKGIPYEIEGKGVCRVATMRGSGIK